MHVQCSPNNTIISLSDSKGNVLLTRSGGTAGFKKAQRSGFEAAYQALVQVASSVKEKGVVVNTLHLKLKGFGQGRDAVFKAITATTNWNIKRITDCTPLPFNGPRPKKKRRL
ncbi:translational machinery component [Ramicandelaber brevisporus]|nr:translational machinery component [Ramicandelaber brevisporus]